jgi:hypothetical protein
MDDDRRDMSHSARNVRGIHERRHRLLVYRTALGQIAAEIARGTAPEQAVWRALRDIPKAPILDQRDAALLAACLVTAVRK